MKEYPVITVTGGQFTIVDGFLLQWGKQFPSDISSKHAKGLLTPGGWYVLRNTYNPISLTKMQLMESNFLLTSDIALFHVITGLVYVRFVFRSGKYFCRRVTKQSGTHRACLIRLERVMGGKVKYIVYDKPVKSDFKYDTTALREQQLRDISKIEPMLELRSNSITDFSVDNLKGFEMPDIMFVSEDILLKIKSYPITRDKIQHIRDSEEKCKAEELGKLGRQLLAYTLGRSEWRLKKLKEYFDSKEEFQPMKEDFTNVWDKCKAQTESYLKDIGKYVYSKLIKEWYKETRGTESSINTISERYSIVGGFLVDVVGRKLVNQKSANFVLTATESERKAIEGYYLQDWNVIKLTKEVFPVQEKELFDIVGASKEDMWEDKNGVIYNKYSKGRKKKKLRCISLHFNDFGWKHICESIVEEAEPEPVPKDEGTLFHFQFKKDTPFCVQEEYILRVKDLREISTYASQRKYYVNYFARFKDMFEQSLRQ